LTIFANGAFGSRESFPSVKITPSLLPCPGIVSQADTYIKRVVNTHLQRTGSLPSWLIDALKNSFPDLDFRSVRFVNIVRWQFSLLEARCVLAGEADAIWEFPDGRWFIADYKMASWTQTQQNLLALFTKPN
jgi:hypothetical protein